MARIIIVGDGPGGLSAALFLAKANQDVTVFGMDRTGMNYAHLHNYLGAPDIGGTALQEVARAQVQGFGARMVVEEVEQITTGADGFIVHPGGECRGDYLVLAEGGRPRLAAVLGLEQDDAGAFVVDRNGRSSMDRVYVVGRATRPARAQAIISAGDGAAAALDILSIEAGRDIRDWDTPPETGG